MRKLFLKAVLTIASGLGLTDPRLYNFLSGGPTLSGENVSPQTAMHLDAVFGCVRLYAQTIATLPCLLYQRDVDGHGVIARDHPLFTLLHDKPNADMTAVSFWECMVAGLLLWGNAYAKIERRFGGSAISLYPLTPDRLSLHRADDGSLEYHYRGPDGVEIFGEGEIFHLKAFSVDGLTGLSPISQARESLGIALAAEKSAASFFRNAMRPSVVWSAPGYMSKEQRARARETIDEMTGSIAAGRSPVIEGGWKLETLSLNPQDAELLASRGFSVEQICRWFGVHPVLIGYLDKSTSWGSGLEQMNLWFLTYGLRPYLKSIEQEISRSLLTPVERILYYAEFNADALLRTDSAARAAMMQTLALNGLRTRNELRALDNMPAVEGGDVLTVAANLIPVDQLGKVAQLPRERLLEPTQANVQAPQAKPESTPA